MFLFVFVTRLTSILRLPKIGVDFSVAQDLEANADCTITINLHNRAERVNDKVYAPRYHKPKDYSWWLILGSAQGELLAIKRIGNFGRGHQSSLTFAVPEELGTQDLTLHVVSDCVLGVDCSCSRSICVTKNE